MSQRRKIVRRKREQPFTGEWMTCELCGKRQRSSPHDSAHWTLLQPRRRRYYFCPDHIPPDGSPPEAYAAAYQQLQTAVQKKEGYYGYL